MNKQGNTAILLLLIGSLFVSVISGGFIYQNTKQKVSELQNFILEQKGTEGLLGAMRPSGYIGKLMTRLAEGGSESSFNTAPSTLPDGTYLNATNIGDFIVISINPGGDNEEKISASSVSVSSSTATWTIANRGLEFGSTTVRTANKKAHAIGEVVIISNDDQFLTTQYVDIDGTQTISGVKTFSSFPLTPSSAPSSNYQVANKKYADDLAIAGAPNATYSLQGLVELATTSEIIAGSATGSTGAYLVPPNLFYNTTSSATNVVPVTKTSGKLSQGFLDLTEGYTFSGENTYSGTSTFSAETLFTNQGENFDISLTNQARGDLLFATSSTQFIRLASSTSGLLLRSSSTPIWDGLSFAQSATSTYATTTTNQVTVATATIPANLMGITGGIRISSFIDGYEQADNYTVEFGGQVVATTTLDAAMNYVVTTIMNRGATNYQISGTFSVSNTGQDSDTRVTTINTTQNQTLNIKIKSPDVQSAPGPTLYWWFIEPI